MSIIDVDMKRLELGLSFGLLLTACVFGFAAMRGILKEQLLVRQGFSKNTEVKRIGKVAEKDIRKCQACHINWGDSSTTKQVFAMCKPWHLPLAFHFDYEKQETASVTTDCPHIIRGKCHWLLTMEPKALSKCSTNNHNCSDICLSCHKFE